MAEDPESWTDLFELLEHTDALLLGRVMYPAYEKYWTDVLADPARYTPNAVKYARLADRTPHFVLSRTLESVAWKAARIVRDVEEVRRLKQQPGQDIQIVGGAGTISSLLDLGLVDEIRLLVNPLLLAGGKPLFGDVDERRPLKLTSTKPFKSGKVRLTYAT